MSRFNVKQKPEMTVNRAGGEAFVQSPELALASLLLTSFTKDQFYRSGSEQVKDVLNLAKQVDPLFVAKAALLARREFNMRSISHVAAIAVAMAASGTNWGTSFFNRIVVRPDDMTEILSLWFAEVGKRPIPNSMKKGFAIALGRLSEYQLAKYRNAKKEVSLVDVVNLVHPEPTEAIGMLVRDELRQEKTHEDKLSKAGQEAETAEELAELKAEVWKDQIESGDIGYFALLRNLRNIERVEDEKLLNDALLLLVDENRIRNSRVLPLRFLSAYENTEKKLTHQYISAAIDIAVDNVPVMEGRTLLAVDVSASMLGSWGGRPTESTAPIFIATLFAAAIYKTNDADLLLFDTSGRFIAPDPSGTVMGIQQFVMSSVTGGGTDFNKIFTTAGGKPYDRIVILSDMQAWVGWNAPTEAFRRYREISGAHPRIFTFDLTGYGDMQFPEPGVFALTGLSEKVFDIMALYDVSSTALIDRINAVSVMGR